MAQATIPANTAQSSPVSVSVAIPACTINLIDIEVPPGPAGLMGFYLACSGQQVIPFNAGQFIIWDNYRDTWALDNFPETGAWSVVGYNLDNAFGHTVTIRYHTDPLNVSTTVPTVTIVSTPVAQIPVTL